MSHGVLEHDRASLINWKKDRAGIVDLCQEFPSMYDMTTYDGIFFLIFE